MRDASSEARNTTAPLTSDGRIKPPNACQWRALFSCSARVPPSWPLVMSHAPCQLVMSVSTKPGMIALTRTPYGANSSAAAFISPSTPCLAAV